MTPFGGIPQGVQPKHGTHSGAYGEGNPKADVMFDVLDGSPKLRSFPTITCQEMSPLYVFGLHKAKPKTRP
jgi:hypothetical protein